MMIGVDPAKRVHAMAGLGPDQEQLAASEVVNDTAGYRDMRLAKRWPRRTWTIESASGIGVQLALRLVADGKTVIDSQTHAGGTRVAAQRQHSG